MCSCIGILVVEDVCKLLFQCVDVILGIGECWCWGSGFLDVHAILFLVLVVEVPGYEWLSLTDLPVLAFFTDCIAPHGASFVIHSVVFCAVRATVLVLADGVAGLVFFLVKVSRHNTTLTFPVVFSFGVIASTSLASHWAFRVDLVTVFPAPGALDEFDLFGPLHAVAWCVEQEEGVVDESLKVFLVQIWDSEGDVSK